MTRVCCALLLSLNLVASASYAENAMGTVDSPNVGYCVDEHMIEQRRMAESQIKRERTSKFRTNKISKQAVLVDVSQFPEPIVGRYSLSIDLDSVEVKTYLKNERLLLVGNGFNDEALMDAAYDLEFQGFRDVKVLANGRRSDLIQSNSLTEHSKALTHLNAVEALSASATSTLENEYFFLLWGDDLPELKDYGIDYSTQSQSKPESMIEEISKIADQVLLKNSYAKLILVLSDGDQNKTITKDKRLNRIRGLWLLEGGHRALLNAIKNTKISPVRLRDHKFSCITR